ncbi:MAG: class A beta-lactamase-related serine hydrolase, partial [Sphingobacteriales bacterium]
ASKQFRLAGNIEGLEKVTVRMLLNHTSGINDPKNDQEVYYNDVKNKPVDMDALSPQRRLEKYVYGKPLWFTPGTDTRYSNSGYWLLGMIIEKVTGKEVQEAMAERIFRKLGLTNTYLEERENPELSAGYYKVSDGLMNVGIYDKADGDGDPGSGVVSTASDLIAFSEALFSGQLLSARSLQQMLRPGKLKDGKDSEYALGIELWDVDGVKGFGKNGSSIGVDANLIYFPAKKVTIVSFANRGGGTKKEFLGKILK